MKMILANNILIFITLSFIAGIWIGGTGQWPLAFLYGLASALAVIVAISVFVFNRVLLGLKVTVVLFFVIGLIAWTHFDLRPTNDVSLFAGQEVTLEGVVDEIPQTKKVGIDTLQTRYIINVVGITGPIQDKKSPIPASGKIRVNVYSQDEINNAEKTEKINYGDKVKISGKIIRIHGYNNPTSLDVETDLKRQGIAAAMNAKPENIKILKTGSKQDSWRQKLADWQNAVLNTMQKVMPENNKGILSAMVFGTNHGIADNVLKNFAAVGIIHILSVSGAHIVIVAGFLNWLGKMLGIPKIPIAFLAIGGILIYAFISGLSLTVIRASIMGIISVMAVIFDRDKDAANALAFSALIMLTFQPALIFNISFQLSFGATAGIIFLYRPIKNYLSVLPKWISESFAITIAAQLGCLPFIIWYFNSVSLMALIGNLLIIPIIEMVLIIGLVVTIVHSFWPEAAGLIFTFASFNISQSLQLTAFLANVPGAVLYLPTIGVFGGAIYYCFLFCLFSGKSDGILILPGFFKRYLAQKWGKTAVVILCLAFISYLWYPKPLTVHFIDVGQGDSSLIVTPGGKAVLIDTGGILWGDSSDFDIGERVITPYLKHYGVRAIEYLALTHGHQDHAGGAAGVAANMVVKNVILARENHSSAVENMLGYALNSTVIPAYSGQVFEVDGVSFSIEHAGISRDQSNIGSNEVSSVIRVSYGQHSFLLTGDLEAEGEAKMLSSDVLSSVTVLKVGHHGSKTSTTKEFLDVLNPQYAVISVGYNNRFGHPHQSVLARLVASGIKIYRTDQDGAVVFRSDGKNLEVECYRKRESK